MLHQGGQATTISSDPILPVIERNFRHLTSLFLHIKDLVLATATKGSQWLHAGRTAEAEERQVPKLSENFVAFGFHRNSVPHSKPALGEEELLPANLAQTKLSDPPKSIRTKVLAKQPAKHRDPQNESPLELGEVGHQ